MRTPLGRVERVAGAFTALVLLLLATAVLAAARRENIFGLDEPFEVVAHLDRGFGLKNGATVVIRDVEAGVVTDVRLVPHAQRGLEGRDRVRVSVRLFPGFPELLTDATRARVLRPLIGSAQLELVDSGRGAPLERGARIAPEEVAPASLDDKIAEVKDDIEEVKRELVLTLKELRATFAQVASATEALNAPRGVAGRLLHDERLAADVAATVSAGRAAVEETRAVVADLSRKVGPATTEVNEVLRKVDATLAPLPQVLARVERALRDVEKIAANVRDATGEMPELVRKAERGIEETTRTLEAAQRSFLLRGNVPDREAPRREAEALPR